MSGFFEHISNTTAQTQSESDAAASADAAAESAESAAESAAEAASSAADAVITKNVAVSAKDDSEDARDDAEAALASVSSAISGALTSSNNLSDLANANTARTNLGLGTAATTAVGDYATAAQADQVVSLSGAGATTISGTYPNFTIDSANNTYTAGAGVTLTGNTFDNSAPDQTVTLTGAGTTTVSGTYPNFTVTGTGTTYTAGDGLSLTGTEFSVSGVTEGSLTVEGDSASNSNANPEIVLKNLETAVVGSDQSLGIVKFQGKDTNDNTTDYGLITGYASVPTDGSEDGKVTIRVMDEGSYVTPFSVNKNGADVRGRLNLHSDTADHLDPDLVFSNIENPSPVNNVLGQMWFQGYNSAGTYTDFAQIETQLKDVTAGDEDAAIYFKVDGDGTRNNSLTVDKHGIQVSNRVFIAGSGGNSDEDNNWHDPDLVFANYQDAVNGNVLGQCLYYGNDDATTPARKLYAYTEARSSSVVGGSEYGAYKVYLMNDGTLEDTLSLHTNGSTLKSHAFTLKGKSNSATTNANPTFVLSNDEPSANDQTLGIIAFDGNNSAGDGRYYGYISGTAVDPTENVETGRMDFHIRNGQGTTESILQLNHTGASLSGELFIHGPHDSTSGSNPTVVFRNNETAADGQLLGCLAFQGENSIGGQMNYGFISTIAENVTTGQEESRVTIDVLDGSNTGRVEKLRIDKNGIEVNNKIKISSATGSDVENGYKDPDLLFTNNQTGSDSNILGQCNYHGRNDANEDTRFAYTEARSSAVADGAEFGEYKVYLRDNGSLVDTLNLNANSSTLKTDALNVEGSITASGNITAFSDKRLKEEIRPIDSPLEKVQKISGNTYSRNDLGDPHRRYAGVIAQEIEAVLPEAISETMRGIKTVDYSGVIALLVESVKELKSEVDELKSEMEVRGVS